MLYTGADGKKKMRTTGCTEKGEATEFMNKVAHEIQKQEADYKYKRISSSIKGGVDIGQAIDEYGTWMKTIGRAPKTLENNLGVLNRWVNSGCCIRLNPRDVHEDNISAFVNAKSATKFSTRTTILAAFRSFFEFCTAKGYTPTNPAELVRVGRLGLTHEQNEKRDRQPFTDEEVERILAHINGMKEGRLVKPWFWEFAVQAGKDTGLRIGDIAQLEWDSFNGKRIVVWTDKRDKRVDMEMTPETIECISRIPAWDAKYVFPRQNEIAKDTKRRALLSVQFSRILKAVGIKNKSFHCLRRTAATTSAENEEAELNEAMRKMVLKKVGKKLGHSDTRTTEGYLK